MTPSERGYLRIAAIRHIERAGIERLPPGMLMERAAQALLERADRMLRRLPARSPVLALLGPGDNGADALLAALLLTQRGYLVHAYSLQDGTTGSPDAQAVYRRWRAAGHRLRAIAEFCPQATNTLPALVIDGLFGIGLTRPIDGAAAAAVCRLNASHLPVLSVDVPSGIDADRGAVVGNSNGVAVSAEYTVTMIADKPGLHTGPGAGKAGCIEVAALGLDASDADGLAIDRAWVRARYRPRALDTHKGSYGTAMIVGGSQGMLGAALLAARGAQAAGAGRVIAASPDCHAFDPGQPQLMSRHLGTDANPAAFDGASALAIGCGLGQTAQAERWLQAALASTLPLLIDADALNMIAARSMLASMLTERSGRANTLLTPHPLEAARLLGRPTQDVQADRIAAALRIANIFQAQVLLKGAGTIVAAADGQWAIVEAGGPALASAGSGDVLAGIAVAMLGQGMTAFDAGAVAAWLHGRAADRWSISHPLQAGLSSARLPELVTETLNDLE